jgi:heptosyltransferase-1
VLLVKTSSMGDVLHALPALTDAMHAIPGVRFDWVVEEAFQEIPAWHPAVDRVIPVALRRWRKHPLQALWSGEWSAFKRALKNRTYDVVLDSQGLIKSAWIARKARGLRVGYDSTSARESIASYFYHKKFSVDKNKHAIDRQRELFGLSLGYQPVSSDPDSQIQLGESWRIRSRNLLFMTGTSWTSKEWPEECWVELIGIALGAGYGVQLFWGNEDEKQRCLRLAEQGAEVLPRMRLTEIAETMSSSCGAVGVDSGLAHLAAALAVPAVTLYGATDPIKTGARGLRQKNLQGEAWCSPCFSRSCFNRSEKGDPNCWNHLCPSVVWAALEDVL